MLDTCRTQVNNMLALHSGDITTLQPITRMNKIQVWPLYLIGLTKPYPQISMRKKVISREKKSRETIARCSFQNLYVGDDIR